MAEPASFSGSLLDALYDIASADQPPQLYLYSD